MAIFSFYSQVSTPVNKIWELLQDRTTEIFYSKFRIICCSCRQYDYVFSDMRMATGSGSRDICCKELIIFCCRCWHQCGRATVQLPPWSPMWPSSFLMDFLATGKNGRYGHITEYICTVWWPVAIQLIYKKNSVKWLAFLKGQCSITFSWVPYEQASTVSRNFLI